MNIFNHKPHKHRQKYTPICGTVNFTNYILNPLTQGVGVTTSTTSNPAA